MQNFEQEKEKYAERIKKFLRAFTGINPEWVESRNWFIYLQTFHLGQNFFQEILYSDGMEETDIIKSAFYKDVVVYAQIERERKIKKEQGTITKQDLRRELGIEIEDTKILSEQEAHQALLDFVWWSSIEERARKINQFKGDEKFLLEEKRAEMEEIILPRISK